MIVNKKIVVCDVKQGTYTNKNGEVKNYCSLTVSAENESGLLNCFVDLSKVDPSNIKKFGVYTIILELPNIINERSNYRCVGLVADK